MKTLSLVAIALSLAALLLTTPTTVDARRAATATPTVTATWVCPAGEYWQPAMHRCWIDPTAGPTLAPAALIAVTAPAPGYPGPQPAPTWNPYP